MDRETSRTEIEQVSGDEDFFFSAFLSISKHAQINLIEKCPSNDELKIKLINRKQQKHLEIHLEG